MDTDAPDTTPDARRLAEALTREHRDIDGGIEEFVEHLNDDADTVPAKPLLTAMRGLRRHIYLEETILFPPLEAAGMMMPIQVMLREHGQLWRAMDSLTALVVDASAGEQDARDRLGDACRDLLSLLDRHNSKEEPIIYPRADTELDPEASAELARFLRTGRTPEGWVCKGAAA
ncbi:Hemerythrin HHE cation binding domain-containing protein [Paramicrobacterium humi]|uniref:Hemerythrin HHE cation binding domain-containing protein n=1 Tax=Paramicrobacterium humi TaxID=640635 RepID=A0A1H4NY04_9MICO|nr:hemerythrin domain-containing protein [Microbacterium humi]SEC00090.1 Hemerythrin HHE cation binding domain-containing protein [Microbacterium humi]